MQQLSGLDASFLALETANTTGTETLAGLRDTVAHLGEVTRIIQEAIAGDRLPSIVANGQAAAADLRKATKDLPETMTMLRGAIQRTQATDPPPISTELMRLRVSRRSSNRTCQAGRPRQ